MILTVAMNILRDNNFDENSDVMRALHRVSEGLSELVNQNNTTNSIFIENSKLKEQISILSKTIVELSPGIKKIKNNTDEQERQFIIDFENRYGGNWLSGVPDLVIFLKEYNKTIQKNTAIEFGEWLKTFESLTREGGQWVIESQITTEELFNLFINDEHRQTR